MPKRSVSPGSWILAIAVLLCLIVYARSSFAAVPLGQFVQEMHTLSGHSSRPVNHSPHVANHRHISKTADDLLFADGFGDEPCDGSCGSGGDPPVCDAPPADLDWAGTQTYAELPEVGADQLTQIKLQGGTWRAYSFTRGDMPGDVTEFNADTSNPGPGAIGADVRYWSVSECAGDFIEPPGCAGFVNEGPFAYLDYSGLAAQGTCSLDPAKTYFLNVHVGPNPCNSTRPGLCGFRVKLLPR